MVMLVKQCSPDASILMGWFIVKSQVTCNLVRTGVFCTWNSTTHIFLEITSHVTFENTRIWKLKATWVT